MKRGGKRFCRRCRLKQCRRDLWRVPTSRRKQCRARKVQRKRFERAEAAASSAFVAHDLPFDGQITQRCTRP